MKRVKFSSFKTICCGPAGWFLIFMALAGQVSAQKEDFQWVLGGGTSSINDTFRNMIVDFNNSPTSLVYIGNRIGMVASNASICDKEGQLLCYTNGETVLNMKDDTIENAGSLIPGNAGNSGYPLPQCQVLFHYPGHSGKVVMFSGNHFYYLHDFIDGTYNTTGCKVQYSIVDMIQNDGAGKMTLVEEPILDDTLFMGRFTACRHANGRDWWIIGYHNTDSIVYKFLLDPQGVKFHDKQFLPAYNGALGQAVFSPDGNHFAQYFWVGVIGQGDRNIIEIYDFDRCTGQFSNRRVKTFSPPGKPGGMAFSGDSRFLYFSNWDKIFQYDMTAPDIIGSQTTVATYDGFIDERGFASRFYQALLAPDNKIYISVSNINSRYLHVIDQPEQAGEACDVQQHSIFLPVYNNYIIPNIPYPRLFGAAGTVCDSLGLSDADEPANNPPLNISVSPNPAHGSFTISFDAPLTTDGNLIMTDVSGKMVFEKTLSAGDQRILIYPPQELEGIYFLQLETDQKRKTVQKIVLKK